MLYLIVFIGAGIGGALRHGVNVGAAKLFGFGFPFGTFIVNVVGSFVMGLLAGYFVYRAGVPQHMRLFLTTGILGGFTTFSTFSLDAALLIERHQSARPPAMSLVRSPRASPHCSSDWRCLGAPGTCPKNKAMNIDLIPIGDDPPNTVNVIIEVPVGGEPVKYEFDKKSGALFVDRILHTPMRYPANYGFVPHTLSPDGDPIDALVDRALAVHPRLRRPRAADRRAVPRGRAWRRREADRVPGRIRPFLIIRTSASGRTCRRSSASRSSISSPTTRISSPTNGCGSAAGAMPRRRKRVLVEAIERAKETTPSPPEARLLRDISVKAALPEQEARHGKPGPHLFRAPRRRGAGAGAERRRPRKSPKRIASCSAPISSGRASATARDAAAAAADRLVVSPLEPPVGLFDERLARLRARLFEPLVAAHFFAL